MQPRVPKGWRIYAVGDLHGRCDLLRRMHRLIAADSANAGAERPVVVYLGDYVDRGPAAREVIDCLLGDPLPGFESIFLKGNHEDMLLQFLNSGDLTDVWLMNGGLATLESYGVEARAFTWDGARTAAMRREFRDRLGARHLGFLRGLETIRRLGDYVFVHAGMRPGIPVEDQHPDDCLWIRTEFLDCKAPFEGVVVHGHSIVPEPEFRANRIAIDTGAYRTGRLSCLVLDGESRTLLQT